jgi:protein-S-isoprenylcysteine O-methyltransferase Ste14
VRAGGWRAVLALPANVLLIVPAILLWLTREGRLGWSLSGPGQLAFWLGLLCLAVGLTLMVRTIGLFESEGEGTLAPWNPTQKLVVTGVYRHVRNPMISGVLFNLLGEALLLRSPAVLAWFAVFFAGNAIYIPLLEEPGLERRFGEPYRRYRQAVPRWIPRLRPYRPDGTSPEA